MFDNKRYNVIKYLKLIEFKEEISVMTLESILGHLKKSVKTPLMPETHKSLSFIETEPFYVKPNFSDISTSQHGKFILFSAPGATGKSALAKHVAFEYNGLYWNLANIKLGDNSFHGTILQAIGHENYSSFANRLKNSNALIVVDAFDEAEMISGRKAIENFISNSHDLIKESKSPCIILLSRTETAQFIASYCGENGIALSHYEIGFFPIENAKDFILKKMKYWNKSDGIAVKSCVDQYFEDIKKLINVEEVDSFIGYAPVLEAIAKNIASNPNPAKLLSSLSSGIHGIDIIVKILDDLLEREADKVQQQLKNKCEGKTDFSNWESLYNKEEQFIRIVFFILFGESEYENYPIDKLPNQIIDDYMQAVRVFLPQHPFIQQISSDNRAVTEFTGPAFRDYVMANLILSSEYEEYADTYFGEQKSDSHFPSQLFWEYYIKINNNNIQSNHFCYVYESFKAKAKAGDYIYLNVQQEDETYVATFGIFDRKKDDYIDLTVNMHKNGFVFDQFSNVTIDVPEIVQFGNLLDKIRFYNSSITCKTIKWKAKDITIESYSPNHSQILCTDDVPVGNFIPKFEILEYGEVRISFPNQKAYSKLYPYKYMAEDDSEIDIFKFIYGMRKIFVHFRSHKKDSPAKLVDKIDNIVLANSSLRKNIFEYLFQNQVFYKEANDPKMYKLNTEKESQMGISWMALVQFNEEQLKGVYRGFLQWLKSQKSK